MESISVTPEKMSSHRADHVVYDSLSLTHLNSLHSSAITDAVIFERGYRTVTTAGELEPLGFSNYQQIVPGLLIPLHTTDGLIGLYVFRPDHPRIKSGRNGNGQDNSNRAKVIKYELPSGSRMRLDCPPRCQPMLNNSAIDLWITEGQKKGDSLASAGLCAVDLLGGWNFKGQNDFGGTTWLADWDFIALSGRQVYITFDSDVMNKPQVQKALDRLTEHLRRKKAIVHPIFLPQALENEKLGVDDWLAQGHGVDDLYALTQQPNPTDNHPIPVYEIMSTPPSTIRRPLSLINGHAYAAVWLHVKKRSIDQDSISDGGSLQKQLPERMLHLMRDDGVLYGPAGDHRLDELDLFLQLPEIVETEKSWSEIGVKNYRNGNRPEPIDVFRRIRVVVDQHIDFFHSIADQEIMLDLCGCYDLSTWFQDVFNVVGYLWSNGEKGSGKSNFIQVNAELSYLGKFLLAGGTYPTLRDLADYGATLAFDDSENLANSNTIDPDKRTLMLAGNHRGAVITVKEPVGNRGYRTRYVNAFCPKMFSAIGVVEPTLASRTIIIPLTRTIDSSRANADPADFESWRENKRQLTDDLWALALCYLPQMKAYNQRVATEVKLQGRPLQPWRSLLAVALWLQDCGVDDLFDRLNKLSVDYQREREGLELSDFTQLVIIAVLEYANTAVRANYASQSGSSAQKNIEFSNQQITDKAIEIINRDEWEIDSVSINVRRVGRTLNRLRLKEVPRHNGRGSRRKKTTLRDLITLAHAYGINLPEQLQAIGIQMAETVVSSGVNGSNGVNGVEHSWPTQNSVLSLADGLVERLPSESVCHTCGDSNWQKCTNADSFYCATCHPS